MFLAIFKSILNGGGFMEGYDINELCMILAEKIPTQSEETSKYIMIVAKKCFENAYGLDENGKSNYDLQIKRKLAYATEKVLIQLYKKYNWINIFYERKSWGKKVFSQENAQKAYLIYIQKMYQLCNIFNKVYPQSENVICVQAIDYILQHLDERLSLSDIADMCYVNYSYLSHLFKENLGYTFGNYVMEVKLIIVKSLLIDSEDSISNISHKVGFEDYKYLGRVFKKYNGVTMSDYRERLA